MVAQTCCGDGVKALLARIVAEQLVGDEDQCCVHCYSEQDEAHASDCIISEAERLLKLMTPQEVTRESTKR